MSLLTDGPAEGDKPSCSSAGSNDMLIMCDWGVRDCFADVV